LQFAVRRRRVLDTYLDTIFTNAEAGAANPAHEAITLQATCTWSVTPGWIAEPQAQALVSQEAVPLKFRNPIDFDGVGTSLSLTIDAASPHEITVSGPVHGTFVPVSGPTPSIVYGVVGSTFITIALCDLVVGLKVSGQGPVHGEVR
jgi:hypothetical protein